MKMSSSPRGEEVSASLAEALNERWEVGRLHSLAGPEAGGLLGIKMSPGFKRVESGVGSLPV